MISVIIGKDPTGRVGAARYICESGKASLWFGLYTDNDLVSLCAGSYLICLDKNGSHTEARISNKENLCIFTNRF